MRARFVDKSSTVEAQRGKLKDASNFEESTCRSLEIPTRFKAKYECVTDTH